MPFLSYTRNLIIFTLKYI